MSPLFGLSMPWWEFVLRAIAVYFAILVLVRMSGKRTVGQFTPFDLIVVVLLGTAVQNSLIGEDTSLLGGLILAATLIALNWATGFAAARSRVLGRWVEGSPVLLARDGVVFEQALRRQSISRCEFESEMRSADCAGPEDIGLAVLETNGHISIVRRRKE